MHVGGIPAIVDEQNSLRKHDRSRAWFDTHRIEVVGACRHNRMIQRLRPMQEIVGNGHADRGMPRLCLADKIHDVFSTDFFRDDDGGLDLLPAPALGGWIEYDAFFFPVNEIGRSGEALAEVVLSALAHIRQVIGSAELNHARIFAAVFVVGTV